MTLKNNMSLSSSKNSVQHWQRVNWHEAAACAIEIELRDYADRLQLLTEYVLGKNSYRIDMLIIKKLSGQAIPKNIAYIFKKYNLFEIKGIHSSLSVSSYYKGIGYAGLLVEQLNNIDSMQYSALDFSITFLTFCYPMKLIRHLTEERNLVVAKKADGIYYISIETFDIQIIVTQKLPPEENLYLRCLTNGLRDSTLINRLIDDYAQHQNQDIYIKYMNQLTIANMKAEGESPMVCEGILNLCGTSSAEIIAKTRKESEAQIRELSESVAQLNASNESLASQVDYLKDLLKKNNISYE